MNPKLSYIFYKTCEPTPAALKFNKNNHVQFVVLGFLLSITNIYSVIDAYLTWCKPRVHNHSDNIATKTSTRAYMQRQATCTQSVS